MWCEIRVFFGWLCVVVVLLLKLSWKRFAHGLDPSNICQCKWTIDLWEQSPIKIEVLTSKTINKTPRRYQSGIHSFVLHPVTSCYTLLYPRHTLFLPRYTLLYSLYTLLNPHHTLHPVSHCYIHVTPPAGCRIQLFVSLFFSVVLRLRKIMDFTVHKLGRRVKCTGLSFQF